MQAFIIQLEEVPHSVESAAVAFQTCLKHNIIPNLFNGFTPKKAIEYLRKARIEPFTGNGEKLYKIKSSKPGVKGCFLSHFHLWKKCIELGEPIMILEHDAFITRDIPDVEFEDVLHLDAWRFSEEPEHCDYDVAEHLEEVKGHNTMRGAYAYIIKPKAAKKLIEMTFTQGYTAADMHISSRAGIKLEQVWPRCAVVTSDESLTSNRNFFI